MQTLSWETDNISLFEYLQGGPRHWSMDLETQHHLKLHHGLFRQIQIPSVQWLARPGSGWGWDNSIWSLCDPTETWYCHHWHTQEGTEYIRAYLSPREKYRRKVLVINTNELRSYGSKLIGKTSPECPEHSPKLGAHCPVTISVALESMLGSLREYSYQLFGVLSLVSVHTIKYLQNPWACTESMRQGFIEPSS